MRHDRYAPILERIPGCSKNRAMPISATPSKTTRNGTWTCTRYWREFLFWLFLVPASAALSSGTRTRQLIGLIETCAFLAVAIPSAGRLKSLGLEFIAWERISRSSILTAGTIGLGAGFAVAGIACGSGQSIGIEPGWNFAVLAIVVGPILEEVIFRGYLLTLALWLFRCAPRRICSAVSVSGVGVIFAAAHLGNTGTTVLQFACIVATGCLYAWIRVQQHSTVGAAIAHAIYNCTLYLSQCSMLALHGAAAAASAPGS
jgi:membrane protease YdiL (CAAX protease family)